MPSTINRRSFLGSTVLAGIAAQAIAAPSIKRSATRPVVISSANGLTSTNDGSTSCVEQAFRLITEGADVLDGLIAGVNIVELDPEDTSVGFGGLPDADGVVTLDSCCMHGPKKRAGAVACLKGVRTPSLVAQAVADNTDHHLLVDEGAQQFARNMGFTIEDDLNTDHSRALWLEWKRRTDPGHYPDPKSRAEAGQRVADHLRQGDAEKDLRGGHSVGEAGLDLAAGHGEDGAAEGFGHVGAEDEADGDDAGSKRVDVDVVPAQPIADVVDQYLPAEQQPGP